MGATPAHWKCSKCNRQRDCSTRINGQTIWIARWGMPVPTGRTREPGRGRFQIEYRCGECGHVGWTHHPQALRKFEELFPIPANTYTVVVQEIRGPDTTVAPAEVTAWHLPPGNYTAVADPNGELDMGYGVRARVAREGQLARKSPPLTNKILDAMNAALAAALAGEEGEGDMADTPHEDLRAAQAWVQAQSKAGE